MTERVVRRFVVSGKVQGVFFRANSRQQAMQLDISGHARHLANGDVEVLAAGTDAAIAQLHQWLQYVP
ncbi:MAG: acylphosphatase, partial [Steroidobacter sp.]